MGGRRSFHWLRALQRHCPASPARAPWMLGSPQTVLRQSRGQRTKGCPNARSVGDALHQIDRQAVRGRGAQYDVDLTTTTAVATTIQRARTQCHPRADARAIARRHTEKPARQGTDLPARAVAQAHSLRRKRRLAYLEQPVSCTTRHNRGVGITRVRTRSDRSLLDAGTGSSVTPSPAQTPPPTCIRSCKPAKPTALSRTNTSSRCSKVCRTRTPPTTTTLCCLGD
ncbi:hypothetical protein QFZ39_005146 [Paraburkholderia graminis]|nr:hypothetical protein [Paraburkholderia graminis]